MTSGLIEHGYSLVNGKWIKTGPITKKDDTQVSLAKKPATKSRNPMKVMKSMKVKASPKKASPKKASVSPMKAMKAVKGRASGSSKDLSPVTPKTRKCPKTPRTPMTVARKSQELDVSPPVTKSAKTKSPKSRSMSSAVGKTK